MNNKDIHYFVTLIETGNVTKAANKLAITQSSLSKFLIRLEKSLGSELFIRHSSPLQLSPAGRIYHEHVKEALARNNLLEQKLKGVRGSAHGEVSIGLTLWRSEALIPAVLPSFYEKYPFIKVKVCEGNHKYIYSLLEKKEIDLGIINLQMSYENYVFEALKRERILLAVNKKNKSFIKNGSLDEKSRGKITHIDYSAFQNEPLIQLKSGQHLHFLLRNFISANGYANNVIFETENISTAYRLVEKNLGITFVPEGLLKTIHRSKEVTFFSLGSPVLSWELGITYPLMPPLSHSAEIFINHLKGLILP